MIFLLKLTLLRVELPHPLPVIQIFQPSSFDTYVSCWQILSVLPSLESDHFFTSSDVTCSASPIACLDYATAILNWSPCFSPSSLKSVLTQKQDWTLCGWSLSAQVMKLICSEPSCGSLFTQNKCQGLLLVSTHRKATSLKCSCYLTSLHPILGDSSGSLIFLRSRAEHWLALQGWLNSKLKTDTVQDGKVLSSAE